MRRCRSLLIAVLVAVVGAAVEGHAQEQAEPKTPAEKEIAVDSDARSDAAIAERIRSIIREIPALGAVRAEVAAGVVTLTGEVAAAESVAEAEKLVDRVAGVVAVRNEIKLDKSVERRLAPAWQRLEKRVADAYDMAPVAAAALLLFALIVVLGLWIASLRWPWQRIAPNAFVAELIRQLLRVAFIAAGIVIALDILGATALLGTILGAAGILGLAVGFALRDTIENYVASIMLSIRQPFQPNDLVRIGDHEGHVIRLTSRATILMSLDGNHVRIPNADVFKGVVVNYTRSPERRFEFTLGVAADCNLKQAVDVGVAALEHLPFVLRRPGPAGTVQDVGDSNVLLWFSGWIDQQQTDFLKARGEGVRLVKRALEDAGFALPEPIYTIRMGAAASAAIGSAGLPTPAGEAARPAAATSESADVGDASPETAVVEKVDAERSSLGEQDLLRPEAPRE